MALPTLQPPFVGIADTLYDALILLEAAKRGMIPRITRRLFEAEREILIRSGSIFIFDTGETNITRWTDGKQWSASRMKDNFLIYRETKKDRKSPDPGHAARKSLSGENYTKVQDEVKRWVGSIQSETAYRDDELVKKTITIQVGGFTQHFISYFSLTDALSGRLRQPSTIPELLALDISPEYLLPEKPYRNPLIIHYGPDGIPRYGGEGDYGSPSPSSRSIPITVPKPSLHYELADGGEDQGSEGGSTHSRSYAGEKHFQTPSPALGLTTSPAAEYFPSGVPGASTEPWSQRRYQPSHGVYLPPLGPPLDGHQYQSQHPISSQPVYLPPPQPYYQQHPHSSDYHRAQHSYQQLSSIPPQWTSRPPPPDHRSASSRSPS